MIDVQQFRNWQKHPVTLQLYKSLGEIRQDTQDLIGGGELIVKGEINRLIRLVGFREGLDAVLLTEADDMVESREDKDDE